MTRFTGAGQEKDGQEGGASFGGQAVPLRKYGPERGFMISQQKQPFFPKQT